MKWLARWAWVAVLGTALALSWWSLDALARHYGMPAVLAAMVSATFDGAALVAADLAIRRAQAADSAASVKLLMLAAVSLSAWLNYEHGALLRYPLAVRVLFAAPPVIAGALFELQLQSLHRVRLRELGRLAEPVPRLGCMVWLLHPLAALKRVHQITGSRLHSVPVTVMDWTGAPVTGHAPAGAPELAAPAVNGAANGKVRRTHAVETAARRVRRLPDEHYAAQLREAVAAAGGSIPSARSVARRLSVGQDRARRLVAQLVAEQQRTST